jgi:hypothetical protein
MSMTRDTTAIVLPGLVGDWGSLPVCSAPSNHHLFHDHFDPALVLVMRALVVGAISDPVVIVSNALSNASPSGGRFNVRHTANVNIAVIPMKAITVNNTIGSIDTPRFR